MTLVGRQVLKKCSMMIEIVIALVQVSVCQMRPKCILIIVTMLRVRGCQLNLKAEKSFDPKS